MGPRCQDASRQTDMQTFISSMAWMNCASQQPSRRGLWLWRRWKPYSQHAVVIFLPVNQHTCKSNLTPVLGAPDLPVSADPAIAVRQRAKFRQNCGAQIQYLQEVK